MARPTPYLVNFGNPEAPAFRSVDDRVMGGRSASRFRITPERTGIFEGVVSLANNGGFASVRAALENTDLSANDGLRARLRGDGKRYRLVLRNDRRLSGLNYLQEFPTTGEGWEEVVLPFDRFYASVRGSTPPGAPPLDRSRVRQAGFMIADGQEGPFRLEVAWIRGWNG